ncbi:MAG: 3-keto-5-aminohexanoate cleavage protein, partial [Clostridiaceae bacterium]
MEKLIVTIAHTGNVPTKALNPHTPVTPEEIVKDIKECA